VKTRIPSRLATVGGILITVSGVMNAALGVRIGALWYDIYPGGRMGHVGIIAGACATAIGFIILLVVIPIYERRDRGLIVLGSILTIVLGHLGAISGALYIGTVGMILCYVAGIWLLVIAARGK
jgi:hypothetical protein